jgi:hypothetical protein
MAIKIILIQFPDSLKAKYYPNLANLVKKGIIWRVGSGSNIKICRTLLI